MSDEHRQQLLIDRYFDEALTVDEAAELNGYLAASESARDQFWRAARLHARLRQWGEQQLGQLRIGDGTDEPGSRGELPTRRLALLQGVLPLGAAALILVSLAAVWHWQGGEERGGPQSSVAVFGPLDQVRWVGVDEPRVGDAVRIGQRIEVASGKVRIDFRSGATVLLEGPTIFEVASANTGFLLLGRLTATADTPEAKGFTVQTRTARAVDLGTVFTVESAPDGNSRFGVISGEVEVHRPGAASPERLRTGDLLSVESGRPQVMVRVERGDETSAFRFPTIEPPSDRDLADAREGHATIAVAHGELWSSKEIASGPPLVLLDGHGQSSQDAPRESVFFRNAETCRLLLDLRQAVSVTKVNTYSWHQNWRNADNRLRAVQKYTLYGSVADTPPPSGDDLEASGWVRIARVDTDAYFGVVGRLDRPAQQACSVTAAAGPLGRYRYLLWDLQPNRYADFKPLIHSFYGEFDVYAQP